MSRKPKTYPELDALKDLLGTVPDSDIAEKAGTSTSIVGRYRRKHGIKAYDGYKFGNTGDAAPKAKTKKAPPKAKAKAPKKKPGRKSKLDAYRDQVGKVPDRDVAEMAGVTPEAVRRYRNRHGIALQVSRKKAAAPAPAPKAGAKVVRKRKSKLDPYQDLLGKVPDAEVAAMAGVTSENVRAYRRRHSIPAEWRKPRKAAQAAKVAAAPAPAPAPAVAAAPAPAGGKLAFAILVDGKDEPYIVFADDIGAAVAAASGAVGGARIDAVEYIGLALG